jgi:type VI secretion system protein ImpI
MRATAIDTNDSREFENAVQPNSRGSGSLSYRECLMALRLTIENVTNLPDGGPISFEVSGERPIDIGRDKHVHWTLPDPTRYISGKHCEIRYLDNSYWLHDVSTNGTFLNGSEHRMRSPYQLKDGDRLIIGHYIIAASLDLDEASGVQRSPSGASAGSQPEPGADLWSSERPAASAADLYESRPSRAVPPPAQPAVADWAADASSAASSFVRPHTRASQRDDGPPMDWASGDPFDVQPAPDRPRPIEASGDIAGQGHPAAGDSAMPATAQAEVASTPLQGRAPVIPVAAQPPPPPSARPPAASPAKPRDAAQKSLASIIARGASVPEGTFANRDDEYLAQELGELMRMSVINLMILLQARNEAKRLTRSRSHTTIQATENNPLKFAPTPEDAMRILFGQKNPAYLDARNALAQGFNDLRVHQQQTYAAMQHAVSMLMAELDPAVIAKQAQDQGGMLDMVRSQKSRLWDTLIARWNASFGREAGASVDAFMAHFADHYDRTNGQ